MEIPEPEFWEVTNALPPRMLSLDEVSEVGDAFEKARGVDPEIWVGGPPEEVSDEVAGDSHPFRQTDPSQVVTDFTVVTDDYYQLFRYEYILRHRWERSTRREKSGLDWEGGRPELDEDYLPLETRLDRQAGVERAGGTFQTATEVREREGYE